MILEEETEYSFQSTPPVFTDEQVDAIAKFLAFISTGVEGVDMKYHGLEVIITMPSNTADPLTHPVDMMSVGIKRGERGEGNWVSMSQIVSILADVPYKLQEGELALTIKDE